MRPRSCTERMMTSGLKTSDEAHSHRTFALSEVLLWSKPRGGDMFIVSDRTPRLFFLFFGGAEFQRQHQLGCPPRVARTNRISCSAAPPKNKKKKRWFPRFYKHVTPTGFQPTLHSLRKRKSRDWWDAQILVPSLSCIISIYRHYKTANVDQIDPMKG